MARHRRSKRLSRRYSRKHSRKLTRKLTRRRLRGGQLPITYDCGGGIRCAEGKNTVVTYKGNDIDSVPTFVSKLNRDDYHEQDLMPE